MVKVYFESNSHAELVAIFSDSDVYAVCVDGLERLAKEGRMFVTESVEETVSIDDIVSITKTNYPFQEGDDYWTIENDRVVWSCWDSESEEMHDITPNRAYFKTSEEAFKHIPL